MQLPVDRWYEALHNRHAWRSYREVPVEAEKLYRLREFCARLSGPGSRARIAAGNTGRIFHGLIASYGQVTGAPAYVAFIGDMRDPNVYEKTGWLGEGIILEAVAMGLSTCWVGATFHAEAVAEDIRIAAHERVLAISPLGYRTDEQSRNDKIMQVMVRRHTREPLDELCSELGLKMCPIWAKNALEAARLAPSAANRQPWRFILSENSITITVDRTRDTHGISKRLDCGIAMLHVELGARHAGVEGRWEYLKPPDVARFTISGSEIKTSRQVEQ